MNWENIKFAAIITLLPCAVTFAGMAAIYLERLATN